LKIYDTIDTLIAWIHKVFYMYLQMFAIGSGSRNNLNNFVPNWKLHVLDLFHILFGAVDNTMNIKKVSEHEWLYLYTYYLYQYYNTDKPYIYKQDIGFHLFIFRILS